MWLQMGEEDGAPLVYFHEVKHMWVGHADGWSGAVEEDVDAGERQAKAQVLRARKMEPEQAVLSMQMQRDAQVAACVDNTSRTVEVWGPGRQVLAWRYIWGGIAPQQGYGRRMGPGHRNAPGPKGNGHG